MQTVRDFWRQGGMYGIEQTAAREAIAEARRRWLPVLEAAVERDEEFIGPDELREIRRLRRLLAVPAPDPSPEEVERRRKLNRERVGRFRERQRHHPVTE